MSESRREIHCTRCQRDLADVVQLDTAEGRERCPNCGSTARTGECVLQESLHCSSRIVLQAWELGTERPLHTGRPMPRAKYLRPMWRSGTIRGRVFTFGVFLLSGQSDRGSV